MTLGEVEFRGTRRFTIRRRVGAGGMGVVYEAYDHERDNVVALKTLRNFDPQSIYRFKNEFRQLADLEHPHLVRLGELHCEDGLWLFTMEYIDGENFLQWVRPHGLRSPHELPPEADTMVQTTPVAAGGHRPPRTPEAGYDEARLRRSLAQLAQAVAFLHAVGKVHRDIKPSNILVTRDGRTVLLDFGLVVDAAAHDPQHTDSQVSGTAHYMAPEQAGAKSVGPEADWYSVGCVLYEALTRRTPFDGASIEVLMQKQSSEPPPPRDLVAQVPSDLDALCAQLLRRDPSARPSDDDVLARLGVAPPSHAASDSIAPAPEQPFLGRERELAELGEAFARVGEGHAVTLFVLGESGQGKSALVRHFLENTVAQQGRVLVLQGRCYEREAVPYKALDRIIDGLSRHLVRLDPVDAALMITRDVALLARLFPVLRRVEPIARVPEPRESMPNPQELRRRAFAALRELLSRVSERQPLILAIDDFQWADADSLALLGEILHDPGAPPLLFLATVRTGSDDGVRSSADLAGAAGLRDVLELQLPRLAPDAARTLARILLGPAGSGAVGAEIAEEAGGHPLFIYELARHVASVGGLGEGHIRLDEVLWARASKLEPPARKLLEIVAAAGEPVPLRVATSAAGLEIAEGARHADRLRSANLARLRGGEGVDTIEPYHDRVRESVLAHLRETARMDRHRALASALEATGAARSDPQVLVRHLEAAGERERAAAQAERAARLCETALAFDRAAELYAAAIRLGRHEAPTQRALRIDLGEALVNAGRGPEAADSFLLAADGADAAVRLDCRRRAAEQLLICGHIERGLGVIRAVLAEIGVSLPPTPRRALFRVILGRARIKLRGLRWKERDESEIAAAALERVDIYRAVAIGLALVDNIRGADFQARGLLAALAAGEPRRIGMMLGQEAVFHATQGRKSVAHAHKIMGEINRLAERTKDPTLRAWATACSGGVAYLGGRFSDARDRLIVGEKMLREETKGTTWELDSARIFLMLALRQLGALDELARRLDDYQRDASKRGDRYVETTLTRACNLLWLVRDDPDAAVRELDRKHWTPPEGGYHLQHWYELRARTELALYRGDREERAALLPGFDAAERSMLLRIQTARAETAWLRGRLALLGGYDDEAAREASRLEGEKMPYSTLWASLLRAALADRKGNAAARTQHLNHAVELATGQQMMLLASVARRRRDGAGGPADGWMAEAGVRDAARLSELIAPGFR